MAVAAAATRRAGEVLALERPRGGPVGGLGVLPPAAARRDQVGGGGRSEKLRTYNFKENRVTDHRIGLTLYRLDRILAGDLDAVTDGLLADERTRQLADG